MGALERVSVPPVALTMPLDSFRRRLAIVPEPVTNPALVTPPPLRTPPVTVTVAELSQPGDTLSTPPLMILNVPLLTTYAPALVATFNAPLVAVSMPAASL